MGTKIRPSISLKNKYWISRHRYYELKHFCLQYSEWKRAYAAIEETLISSPNLKKIRIENQTPADLTAKYAMAKAHYSSLIEMVENAAKEADEELAPFILKAVTEDLSFTNLKTKWEIPCSKDMYYDRYRKFFWILSKARN